MMTNLATQSGCDAETYLAREEQQPEKLEYLAGEVFAMVGATREHVLVVGNLYAALKQWLRGGPCQANVSGLKPWAEAVDAFFYPDAMVSCAQRDWVVVQFIAHPILIAEVLAESTAAFDRGDTFTAYRRLPSLHEYVQVDIPSRRVETFRRTADQDWLLHEHRPELGDCHFPAVGMSIPFEEIFENLSPEDSVLGGQP